MKKILFFIATAITMALAACSSDDSDTVSGADAINDVIGRWYEESMNEEMRLNESGTLYDKYCTEQSSGETTGTWEYDKANKKLTYTYSFMGQTQFEDWTVKNLTENSFTISSSTVANHKLERIVENYTLSVGETATIRFPEEDTSYDVKSYTSLNERLATVTDEGVITAAGEKGTTYIKVQTDKGNVWVSVTVGGDFLDLWPDYVPMLGNTYNQLVSAKGTPDQTDDDAAFYVKSIHTYVSYVCFAMSSSAVTNVQVVLKQTVSDTEIQNYLSSRYYYWYSKGNVSFYLSNRTEEESPYYVAYNKDQKRVYYYRMATDADIPDFKSWFGLTSSALTAQSEFKNNMETVSSSSDSIRASMNDTYFDYATFYFRGKGHKMNSYAVHYTDKISSADVHSIIQDDYTYLQDQESNGETVRIYTNSGWTITVIHYPSRQRIEYYDLTQEEESEESDWLDDTGLLGKSKQEVINQLGAAYEYSNYLVYSLDDAHFTTRFVEIENDKVVCYFYTVKADQDKDELIAHLDSIYTRYLGTSDSERIQWVNGTNRNDSTFGVIYIPNKNQLTFVLL